MANTLVNGTQLASAMIGGLYDAGVLTGTVWKDPGFSGIAGKGSTVNVRKLGIQAATNFAGTATATDLAETTVPVVLSHQPYVQSTVSTAESSMRVEDFYAQVIFPGIAGVAEYLDAQVAAALAGVATTAVSGANAKAALIAAHTALTEAKVPMADRYFAASPGFLATMLGESWIQADTLGDGGNALRSAVVGRAFGFTIVESTHIADADLGGSVAVDSVGYAYHKTGILMASRVPNPPQGGADAATASALGYGARVVSDWSSTALSDIITIDTLAGFAADDVKVVPTYIPGA